MSVVTFKGKRREEVLVRGSIRISYSYDDVLIEDFYDEDDHPYAIYDFNYNLLETNLDMENPFINIYKGNIESMKRVIEEFGVDI